MARKLPPLNALRAFEAAARLGSMTSAAEELCVTQGAISRQIKLLEGYFGNRLLDRGGRELRLTPMGQALLPSLTLALDSIAGVVSTIMVEPAQLRLQIAPTFAIRWLIPRLEDFDRRHSDINCQLSVMPYAHPFDAANHDAGIVYGCGDWPGLEALLLTSERLTPVCAPRLVDERKAFASTDLANFTLLHPTPDRGDWRRWLAATGVTGADASRGPCFPTTDLAIRAAEAGRGFALGDLALIEADLASGRLIAPLDVVITSGCGYYLVYPREQRARSQIRVFHHWLLEQIQAPTRSDRSII